MSEIICDHYFSNILWMSKIHRRYPFFNGTSKITFFYCNDNVKQPKCMLAHITAKWPKICSTKPAFRGRHRRLHNNCPSRLHLRVTDAVMLENRFTRCLLAHHPHHISHTQLVYNICLAC